MPVRARRVFRLALTMALSLAFAYGLQFPLPFLAPLLALMLNAAPRPPIGAKQLTGMIVVIALFMGIGLLLTPMLVKYPLPAILLVALGVYFSTFISVGRNKQLIGTLLAVGVTMITAAGVVSLALATAVVQALLLAIVVATVSQWLVYPLYPENYQTIAAPGNTDEMQPEANWIAIRSTLVVMPAYLLALTNPTMYLPLIMKSIFLGQQCSVVDARSAGRELLGSTLMGGLLAIVFWFALDLVTSLWMFSLWMLLLGIYIAGKLYGVIASRYGESYWKNAGITMLILLGPAVEDSASGNDVYAAFFARISLFIAITLFAWFMINALEQWRQRSRARNMSESRELVL